MAILAFSDSLICVAANCIAYTVEIVITFNSKLVLANCDTCSSQDSSFYYCVEYCCKNEIVNDFVLNKKELEKESIQSFLVAINAIEFRTVVL